MEAPTVLRVLGSLSWNILWRAEKRKFEDQSRQIHELKEKLFPQNGLQERIDNLLPYYAKYGKEFLDVIYRYSLSLEQQFVVVTQVSTGSSENL